MKKHATTIALVLACCALAAWLYTTRDKVSDTERKHRETSVFTAWRKDELSRLEIVHEGETIVLARDAAADSPWRMTSPRKDRADQAAVERLFTTLEFASVARKVSDAKELGFETPRATGSLTMGGLTLSFVLGAASPRPEGSSYFRIVGEPPIVVAKELVDALLAPSDKYRDRTVVPYLSLELSRFEVKGGFVLERLDERSFKVGGLGLLASHEGVDKIWSALAEMRAEAFPKEADVDRLTANPKVTIMMTPKESDKPPAELVIGEACPGHPEDVVVLRKTPTRVAACAPVGVVEALGVKPAALVELRPFTLRADEIEELRLEWLGTPPADAPKAIEIARKNVGFHAREPVDHDLSVDEADAAHELLTRIATSHAEQGIASAPAFAPVARARVRFDDHDETVEIGAFDASKSEGRVVVRRLLDSAFLEVKPDVARRLVPRATSLLPRGLLGDARRVTRIAIHCGVAQEFIDAGEGMRLVEPKGYPTDTSVLQLADALARSKVETWVADEANGGFGLDSAACRVILGFEGGNAPATVRFGADGEGGVYGMLEGSLPHVFVVSKAIRELAERIYVSRAVLRAEPQKIESVRVSRAGKALALSEDVLRDAVSALYPDRVLRLGKPDFRAELEITETLAEVGAPRKVMCARAGDGATWTCATPGVDAMFEVSADKIARFLGERDAGNLAPDAGSR